MATKTTILEKVKLKLDARGDALVGFIPVTDKHGIILAHLSHKKEYVTWRYDADNDDIYMGHYFSDYGLALKSFMERANTVIGYYVDYSAFPKDKEPAKA